MEKPQKIKPTVDEISLAFDPANLKDFLMHKDKFDKEKDDSKSQAEFDNRVVLVLLSR